MSEYYSAAKAKEILGKITYAELSRYVKRGKIRRIVKPGQTNGLYNREDVDGLAEELERFHREIRVIE